ncbi:hypothetical protein KUCAC02_018319 [Chaenocephalus aceratus]|uniref:Uncharacterized protein n=1 Tax=Chaenocephalus aceratus TaxID=36190 RepID=A0ACB9W8W0_CHAAC|nr:hypothetical protein KUCAC02_018319 [Chaenocephalus aceratus]
MLRLGVVCPAGHWRVSSSPCSSLNCSPSTSMEMHWTCHFNGRQPTKIMYRRNMRTPMTNGLFFFPLHLGVRYSFYSSVFCVSNLILN